MAFLFCILFFKKLGFRLLSLSIALVIFNGICYVVLIGSRDRAKGIGISLILFWLFFAIIYDGILLVLMFQFPGLSYLRNHGDIGSDKSIGLARIFRAVATQYFLMMLAILEQFSKIFLVQVAEWEFL